MTEREDLGDIILLNENPVKKQEDRIDDTNMIFNFDDSDDDIEPKTFTDRLNNGLSDLFDQDLNIEIDSSDSDNEINIPTVITEPIQNVTQPIQNVVQQSIQPKPTINEFVTSMTPNKHKEFDEEEYSSDESGDYTESESSDEYDEVHVSTLDDREIALEDLPEYKIELLDEISFYSSQNRHDDYINSAGALNINTPIATLEKIARYVENKDAGERFVEGGIFIIQILALIVEETVTMMDLKNFSLEGWHTTFNISNVKLMNKIRPNLTRIYNRHKKRYERLLGPIPELILLFGTSAYFHGKKISAFKKMMTTNVQNEVQDDINVEELNEEYKGIYDI